MPIGKRNRLDGCASCAGQCPLERTHGAIRFAVRRVDLRFGQRAPRTGVGIGRDFARDVVVQTGVGEQFRFGQMRAVFGEALSKSRQIRSLDLVEVGRGSRLRAAQSGQPLTRHLRIEEVLVYADDGAVIGGGLGRVVILRFVEPTAPVEGGSRLRRAGEVVNLLVEDALGIFVSFPAGNSANPRASAPRKHFCSTENARQGRRSIRQLADSLCAADTCCRWRKGFGQPLALREIRFHARHNACLLVEVVAVAGEFHQQV